MKANVNTAGINAVVSALFGAVGKNIEQVAKDALKQAGAPQKFVDNGQVVIEDGLNVEAEVGPCTLNGQEAWGVTRIVITPTYKGKTANVPATAPAPVDPKQAKINKLVGELAELIS